MSSKNAFVWKVEAEAVIFIKFFFARGVRDMLFFRKSRARRAAEGSLLLIKNGFLAPALLAQGDILKGLLVTGSFLITRAVEQCLDTYAYLETFCMPPLSGKDIEAKRNFIAAAGRLIGRLHRTGIVHGDLRPGNILIRRSEDDLEFYFIDNERNRYFRRGVPARLREKNLVQINMILTPAITFTDRMRFFRAYLEENPEIGPHAGKWIRNVFARTKKRLQKRTSGIWGKKANQLF
ncbi:MAG: lipopolysaccharide kinase InaA family protein [Nitrospirota bacterium]